MKRFIAVLLVVLATACLMTGCSSGMKDGTYKAQFKDYDDHGWTDYVSITVKDGKITDVDYDSMNADGTKKSEDQAYRESMEPVSKTYPAKFYKELEDQLSEKQDPKKVDAVTGATNSSNDFKILAVEAIKAAKAGTTDAVEVSK